MSQRSFRSCTTLFLVASWLVPLPIANHSFHAQAAESAVSAVAVELDGLLATEVFKDLAQRQQLAPRASDEIFLRRVYLDLVGQPPTPDEVKQFVHDPSTTKRQDKIAALLSDRRFGINAGNLWRDILLARQNVVGEGPIVDVEALESFLSQQFNNNVPWDKIVRAFVEATGTIREHGETAVYIAQRLDANEIAGEMSRIFLGIQIQCAQCHDHPTSRWKRQQFHEFAAFFPRVGIKRVERAPRPDLQVTSFDDGPMARTDRTRFVGLLEHLMPDLKAPQDPGTVIPPAFFLTGKRLGDGAADEERRRSLAEWMTGRDNPWFSKAFVNRVWAELVGEGFFDPVDDMGPDKPCSAPRTLDYLASQFTDHGYDVKWLYRTIVESEAYQRESRPRRKSGEVPFTANVSQPLRPDQLGSVLFQAVGLDVSPRHPIAPGKVTLPQRSPLHGLFGYDPSVPRMEIASSIPQTLLLMNSEALNQAIAAQNGNSKLSQLLAAAPTDEQAVTDLYLRTLAREPNEREKAICLEHVKGVGNRENAFEDLFWSLLNSEELRYRN